MRALQQPKRNVLAALCISPEQQHAPKLEFVESIFDLREVNLMPSFVCSAMSVNFRLDARAENRAKL